MTECEIDTAKSLAAVFGDVAAIAAGIAGDKDYELAAVIAGGGLIITRIGLALSSGGKGNG
jgi:hypothetical protein